MAAPNTGADLIDLLAMSELLEPATLEHYRQLLEAGAIPGDDPSELARMLVHEGLLTRFQVGQILLGSFRNFCLGKYKILDQIGSGGMAKIYLAEHRQMKHRVAIKVLPPAKAQDRSALERFYREARAIAALQHPNIIRAHDIDHEGDLHFLVMELIHGSNLEEVVHREGPLTPADAIRYLRQTALGLQHAFVAGLVHRDIKPSNLLVDRAGTVKILDLGLARFFRDDQDNLSQKFNEKVLGTADYLAPEQGEESHKVDIRADIYSLGCTGYFCLTGRPPFPEGSFTQKLLWHQVMEPKPLTDFREDLPAELIAVIEKMMAKDPTKRYQTPAEVAQALAALSFGKGEPATWETAIVSQAEPTRRETKLTQRIPILRLQKPRRLWLVGGAWLLLVTTLLALWWFQPFAQRVAEATPPTPTTRTQVRQGLVPRMIIQCGKRDGKQNELMLSGFGYQLKQGRTYDGWPESMAKRHCWFDNAVLKFELRMIPGRPTTLRFHFVDGQRNIRQQLLVQDEIIAEIEDFSGAGRLIEVSLTPEQTKDGRVDVEIQKLSGSLAVVSTIEVLTP